MPRDRADVETALMRKGFEPSNNDHKFFTYVTQQGKKSLARTKTSFTPKMKVIDDTLLAPMARQCGLTKREFMKLVDCPMSRQEYEDILAAKGWT